jgi:Co/Zn/Cd efflux system component
MRNDLNQGALKHAVMQVALLNFAWFFVEFAVARHIGSVSLFADSIDFLEDTCVNFLVLVALGWSARRRASVGTLLAVLLLVPAAAAAWMAWRKFQSPLPPEVFALSATGAGALVVNLYCAWLLVRLRNVAGSLSRAAFLSARNDAFANLAIIAAGGATLVWPSAWPDLAVGIGILLMNLDAAREVLIAARSEADEAA